MLPELFADDGDELWEDNVVPEADEDQEMNLVQSKFGFGSLMRSMGLQGNGPNYGDYGYGSPPPPPPPAAKPATPAGSGSGMGSAAVVVGHSPAAKAVPKLFEG